MHFIDTIFGPSKPESIACKGTLNSYGTDENMSAVLKYPEGKIAVISTHTKVNMDNSAYIYGTKGTIKVIRKIGQLIIALNNTRSNFFEFVMMS